ncbi:MAG: YbgC/FadM family acyl-CoA thioesterase [Gammaproteobacteria bacterium]|nr:YbgC/FadM family acyl-CoA thioesterase [Gammaproteobacteria bacterium]MDH5241663.1 YbgC/FadM family acyl-CoA thioesterase [Gammaproteobacteria bacterium]MDH5260497.1 YbgC/FadM family acyl-CoA thioesterase [Gammaproteobacteria bacterium]MDH5582363.1 YbgC/FadM family acyl-CoA thioesterase [Gammaproteobacteria bacterium]
MSLKPFELQVRVYYEDTDAQGVVYYANYFRFMERARTEWLEAMGVDHVTMMKEDNRILVVTEAHAKFIIPARLGDTLVVTAGLSQLSRATFEIEQNIYRGSSDGELLIQGGVTAAYLAADTMRPKRIPQDFLKEIPS